MPTTVDRADYTPKRLPDWRFIAKSTLRGFTDDKCSDLAAGLTYYTVMAIFPALLAVISILGIVGEAEEAVKSIEELIGRFAPAEAASIVARVIEGMAEQGGAGIALIIGIVLAIWSASGYVAGFGRMMNQIYGVEEGRNPIRLRLVDLLVTLIIIVAAVVGLLLVVSSGPVLRLMGELLGLGDAFITVFNIIKWPVLVLLLIGAVALLYHVTPNVKFPKVRLLSPGAVVAIVGCLVASVGFAIYVANFGNYNKTYGALGGVIVMLLWLQLTNTVLLLGAELDAELARFRELKRGLPSETGLQLPLVSDTQIQKKLKADHEWEVQAAMIREEGIRPTLKRDAENFFGDQAHDEDGFVRPVEGE